MKRLALALVLLLYTGVAHAQWVGAGVTVSFGTPYSAGPSQTQDGWWVPIVISNPNQVDFRGFKAWSKDLTAPWRNIHFGGNVKPVLYCWPGTNPPLCSARIGGGGPDDLYLDGNYWPDINDPPYAGQGTNGGINPESSNDPDSAYMELAFGHMISIANPQHCENWTPPTSGTAMTIRVVKRYDTPQSGVITLAATSPDPEEHFSSLWHGCYVPPQPPGYDPEPHPVNTGYALTIPPPGQGGGGGGGGHEEGVTVSSETVKQPTKPRRRSSWGAVKQIYR